MYQVLVLIHLISAITWLGGMLFLLMVMIPLTRRNADVGFGTLRAAAEKFVPIAWAAKLVLAGSGAYLAWEYWNVRHDTFFTGSTDFLDYLQRKTGIFVIVIILSFVHDFWLGPRMMDRLEQARATGTELPRGVGRLFVQWAARINLVLVIWIVAFAVWMTRG